jgi:hypothetical protein
MYRHLHDIEQVRVCGGELAKSIHVSNMGCQTYR